MRNFRLGAVCGSVAFTLAAVIANPAANADIIIDDFSSVSGTSPWPMTVTASSPNAAGAEVGVTGVLGGTRLSNLDLLQSQAPFDNGNANLYPAFGLLDFNSTSGAGARLTLTYPGLGGLNADFSTELGVKVDFTAFDLGSGSPTGINVELFDGVTSASLTKMLNLAGPQISLFDFASFSNIGTLNLNNIQSVKVTFNVDGNLGVDFRVRWIGTFVPAPGAMALLGFAGLVAKRRRR